MTTKQQKIDAIYEKVANKDLSFGCIVKGEEAKYRILKAIQPHRFEAITTGYIGYGDYGSVVLTPISEYEIIGHPIMIGDIMEYFYGSVRFSEWGKCWRKLTKPVEEQSDGCINFIYSLISEQGEK